MTTQPQMDDHPWVQAALAFGFPEPTGLAFNAAAMKVTKDNETHDMALLTFATASGVNNFFMDKEDLDLLLFKLIEIRKYWDSTGIAVATPQQVVDLTKRG